MRHAWAILAIIASSSFLYAANDKQQANGRDDAWENGWVTHCRTIYNGGTGKTAGFVLHIGDSITYSGAYSSWPRGGAGKTSEDNTICSYVLTSQNGSSATDTSCKSGFFLAKTDIVANRRSMTAASGISTAEYLSGSGNGSTAMPADTNPVSARAKIANSTYDQDIHIDTLIAAFNDARFAVLMLGTNDLLAGRTASAFNTDLTTIVNKLEAQNIVVIISTIPPNVSGAANIDAYNTAIRTLAQTHGLPLIDFYAECLARRPGTTWQNTLISGDGTHPSGAGGGYDLSSDPYSGGNSATHQTGPACDNVGYLLRGWLTMQKLKEVKDYIVDGNSPPSTPVLTSIVVTPSPVNIQAGATQQFTAVGKDQFNANMVPQPSFTWSVSSGGGSVNASGLVTATTTSGSSYTVTATSGAISGGASYTVIPSTTVGSITVTPTPVTVASSTNRQFNAVAKDPFNNTMSPQPSFTWTVSLPAAGSVNSSGLYTAGTTAGTYSVTASAGGKNGSASVTVTVVTQVLTTITVSPANPTIFSAGTQQFGAVAYDQFGSPMASQPSFAWTATGGTVSSGGLYTAGIVPGGYTVTAGASGKSGSTGITVSNRPPDLQSSSITPNPALVDQSVAFSAAATDVEGTTLTYGWSFGDGQSAATANAAHAYPAAGVYPITLTITDGGGAKTTLSFTVRVTLTGGGGEEEGGGGLPPGGDSDGDGVSNNDEKNAGTDPNDPNSRPGGTGDKDGDGVPDATDSDDDNDGVSDAQEIADGTNPWSALSSKHLAFTVSKVSGSMKFTGGGGDSVQISGVIPSVPAGFNPSGVAMTINVGGAMVAFTLDGKGKAVNSNGSVTLTLKPSTRNPATKQIVFNGGNVTFKAKLMHGTFAPLWKDEGIDPQASANATLSMAISVLFNGQLYGDVTSVKYSGKAGKTGKFIK